jgi:hypothetical protein
VFEKVEGSGEGGSGLKIYFFVKYIGSKALKKTYRIGAPCFLCFF